MRSRQVLVSAAQWFTRIYDENLLGCNSEPELDDFMILLRSNGNQAFSMIQSQPSYFQLSNAISTKATKSTTVRCQNK